jgi:hypothetical protein
MQGYHPALKEIEPLVGLIENEVRAVRVYPQATGATQSVLGF